MSAFSWFPDGVFGASPEAHRFNADCYGYALSVLWEPTLYPACESDSETYRLLVLPTFTCPVAIRVFCNGTSTTALAKRGSGRGGYDPGELAEEVTSLLADAEWMKIQSLITKSGFWSLASTDRTWSGGDGTTCVLEGSRDGRYHVVDRWQPREGPFRDLCSLLLRIGRPLIERLHYDPLR